MPTIYAPGQTIAVLDTAVVQPPIITPPSAGNFLARSTAPGVFFMRDWTNAAQLNSGAFQNCFSAPSNFGNRFPFIDNALLSLDGTPSLGIRIPSNTDSNPGGWWTGNYSPDLSLHMGPNTEHFWQIPVWWNDVIATTAFRAIGGGPQLGIKFFDLVPGDFYTSPNAVKKFDSSGPGKLVCQGWQGHKHPHLYRYYDGATSELFEDNGPGDWLHQNKMPGCTYKSSRTVGPTAEVPGCWAIRGNEWATFQIGVTLGAAGTVNNPAGKPLAVFLDSRVRLWAQRGRAPSQLLIDYGPGTPGYKPLSRDTAAGAAQFGRLILLPYFTNKDQTQAHGAGEIKYGPIIGSTQRIADVA